MAIERAHLEESASEVIAANDLNRTTIYKWIATRDNMVLFQTPSVAYIGDC